MTKAPLYAKRDIIALRDYYTRHVDAMTGEALHAKSAIAAELAHRDMQIARLMDICTQAHDRLLRGDDDRELMALLATAWEDASSGRDTAQAAIDDPSFNGMSLRDYAAVRFMAAFLTDAVLPPGFDAREQLDLTSARAYECADALLRARAALKRVTGLRRPKAVAGPVDPPVRPGAETKGPTMDRLEEMMQRLDRHQPLTAYECLRLVMIAQHAAAFTAANDRGDDADAQVEEEGGADSGDTYEALLDAATKADEDYYRSKDELFCATRELMGWPGRPAKYLPAFLGGGPVHPHPFEQEGGEG